MEGAQYQPDQCGETCTISQMKSGGVTTAASISMDSMSTSHRRILKTAEILDEFAGEPLKHHMNRRWQNAIMHIKTSPGTAQAQY